MCTCDDLKVGELRQVAGYSKMVMYKDTHNMFYLAFKEYFYPRSQMENKDFDNTIGLRGNTKIYYCPICGKRLG